MFTLSETKLNRVLRSTTTTVQDMGLHWNPKKRNVIHVRRGKQAEDVADLRLDETALVENLTTGSYYSCGKDVLAKALTNLDEPSVRRQPCQGNKPICPSRLGVPYVDPTLATGRVARHRQRDKEADQ